MICDFEIIQKYSSLLEKENDNFFVFMNNGYVDVDAHGLPKKCKKFFLNEQHLCWLYQANLYYNCLKFAGYELNDNVGTLLDLSCGRGGGIKFIQDNFKFEKLIGLDVTPFNIQFCKKWINGIEFLEGSAVNINLDKNSVDLVTSIEACTYYYPFEDYVNQVYKVLRKGGLLIQASAYKEDDAIFKKIGFKKIFFKDINYNVSLSIALTKYILRQKSEELFHIFFGDERRFVEKNSDYNITVYKK